MTFFVAPRHGPRGHRHPSQSRTKAPGTEGISRYDLGREKFLEEAWKWKEAYGKTIHEQWAKLGLSVDYSRERFTLDAGLNKAVKHVFVTLYNEGLIYQGERIINWDPELTDRLKQHRNHPQRR
jgi:valyl-tRNA synthetase